MDRLGVENSDESSSSVRHHKNMHVGPGKVKSSVSSFDQLAWRRAAAKFIACTGIPITVLSSLAFSNAMRSGVNPNFIPVSVATHTKDLMDMYIQCVNDTARRLESIPEHNIAVTSDIWNDSNGSEYLRFVIHYVDPSWKLRTQVIGFTPMLSNHSDRETCEMMDDSLKEFKVTSRLIAITMDNTSYDKTTIDQLRRKLGDRVDEALLYQRCAAHIINLMLQKGLKYIGGSIKTIREALMYTTITNDRRRKWKNWCTTNGMEVQYIATDMEVRWNSTFIMLDRVLPYAKVLRSYMVKETREDLLHDEVWSMATAVHAFLLVFYDSTNILSSATVPTTPLAIHKLYEISKVFAMYKCSHFFAEALTVMRGTWVDYFYPMPMVYLYAFILDPRIRLDGLRIWLSMISINMDLDYSTEVECAKTALYETYKKYEIRYTRKDPQSALTSSPCETSWRDWRDFKQLRASATTSSSSIETNQLTIFLATEFRDLTAHKLDLLRWWKDHSVEFPILAILARDILTIPVSSLPSEATFSREGLILEDRRARLKPEMLKILTCIKEWERDRQQLPTEYEEYTKDWLQQFDNFNNDE